MELARETGVSEAMLHAWKPKHGRLELNEARRLRGLEQENSRLKKLVAGLSLDKDALRTVIRKNGWSFWSHGAMRRSGRPKMAWRGRPAC